MQQRHPCLGVHMWCVKDKDTAVNYKTGGKMPLYKAVGKYRNTVGILGLTQATLCEGTPDEMIYDDGSEAIFGFRTSIIIPYTREDYVLYSHIASFDYYDWDSYSSDPTSLTTSDYMYAGNGVIATYRNGISEQNKAFRLILEYIVTNGMPADGKIYLYAGKPYIEYRKVVKMTFDDSGEIGVLIAKCALLRRQGCGV